MGGVCWEYVRWFGGGSIPHGISYSAGEGLGFPGHMSFPVPTAGGGAGGAHGISYSLVARSGGLGPSNGRSSLVNMF